MGARIVNAGWGSTSDNPALKEAIENSDMLFICAAGNNGVDIDTTPVYPASFNGENIISVASVNRNGLLSAFSDYGPSSVHVAAPGEEIISTAPGDNYEYMSGTSMAAAFVSAEAALILAGDSSLSPTVVKERIIKYSDSLSSLTGKILSGNKINFRNAINEIYNDELIFVEGESTGIPIPSEWDDFILFNEPSTGLLNVVQVFSSNYHSLSLRGDGTVWAWGYNSYGQLGDGTTTTRPTPVQVSGLTGVQAIAGGYNYSLALKEDGTVWAWGDNYYGQLGDGTTTARLTPVQVSGLTGVQAIAGGYCHGLALRGGGTVWAWGRNNIGQLGDGRVFYSPYPMGIYGTPPNVTATLTDTQLALSYGIIGGTVYYEIEIDGSSINNNKNTTYTYLISTPGYLPTYRVRSINESGPGLWSVNAISSGSFGAITTDSIEVLWEPNGNPDGTLYKIAAYDTDDLLVTENDWTGSLSDTITNLSENTSYIIKIKAKNEDGVETGWHEIGTATSLSPVIVIYEYDANGNLIRVRRL